MKHSFLIILISFCFFYPFNVEAQDTRGSNPIKVGNEEQGIKRALVVGVSDYNENRLKLNYAHNDAVLFKEYLKKVENLEESNISFLINKDAVSLSIMRELRKLMNDSQKGDVVYIYFAGHGDVVNDFGEEEGFLLAADANANQEYYGTGGVLELKTLNNVITKITDKGAKVILILDACRSGFIFKEGTQKNLQTINNNFQHSTKFLSCEPNQLSFESRDLKQGYFTYYLVLGLMGAADQTVPDNKIQYFELEMFLNENVKNETNRQQVPVVWNKSATEVFKNIDLKDKTESLETLKNTGKIKDLLASRGYEHNLNKDSDTENPIVKKFNSAIESENYYGTADSAYEIFKRVKSEKNLPENSIDRMQYALTKSLSVSAQMLINLYIDEKELPHFSEFSQRAKELEICLELLEEDSFMKNRILTSKLFLEAYSIIRANNFSNYNTAKTKLLKALEIEPRAAYVHHTLGRLYSKDEQFEKAYEHYTKAIELIPTWSFPVNNLGINYLDQFQYKEAEKYFKQALELTDNKSVKYNNLGVVYQKIGNYSLAEQYYKEALKYDSEDVYALKNIGVIYEKRGKQDIAEQWYEKAVKADNTENFIDFGLMNYINYRNLHKFQAEKLLQKALQKEPYYSDYHSDYADFARELAWNSRDSLERADRFKHSDSLYLKAIELNPYNTWAYAGRGYLWSYENTDIAIQSFEDAIKTNPNKPEVYYRLADFLETKTYKPSYQEVERLYLKSIEINPFYVPAYEKLSYLYKKEAFYDRTKSTSEEKNEKFLQLLKPLIESNPELPDLWNYIGKIYLDFKDYALAEQAFHRITEIDSSYAKAYSNTAYSKIRVGKYEQGRHFYELAIRSDNPDQFKKIHFSVESISSRILPIGSEKILLRDFESAKKIYEIAVEFDENIESYSSLALINYLMGDVEQAYNNAKNADLLVKQSSNEYEVFEYQDKINELLLKIAIDKNDVELVKHYFQQYNNSEWKWTNPNNLIKTLYYDVTGDNEEAKKQKEKIHPLMLRTDYLELRFSKNTIRILKNI